MTKEIIYHCKNKKESAPYATIVIHYDLEKDTCTFGVAVCHQKDEYVKKVGTALARQRIEEGKTLVLSGFLCYYPKAVAYSLNTYLMDVLNNYINGICEETIDYLVHSILACEMDYWKTPKKAV